MFTTPIKIFHLPLKFQKIVNFRFLSSEIPSSPFKNVVVVSKRTGYVYEKSLMSSDCEENIRENLSRKGKDYDRLRSSHEMHMDFVKELAQCLIAYGLNVKLVDSHNFDYQDAEWSDLVITTGGDGTFLYAAGKILSQNKPIVGINSRPQSSEGSLCLPKGWYHDIAGVVDRLVTGTFSPFWRQRIRILTSSVSGPTDLKSPEGAPELISLHRITPQVRHEELETTSEKTSAEALQTLPSDPIDQPSISRLLPIRALNEIFISSCMSATVSHYEISLDDSPLVRQKSSGIAICTGTGSSSWFYNMNQVHAPFVASLLKIAQGVSSVSSASCLPLSASPLFIFSSDTFNGLPLQTVAEQTANEYNRNLLFDPQSSNMAYSIRHLIENSVFKFQHPYGFTNKVKILSRMDDGYLSIDGRFSIPFHDGTWVELSIHPEDALCTIKFN